jgi:1-deoxyxylulose-5-phosphate synthase
MEKVEFGSTGLIVSRLNIGTGSDGWAGHSQQTDLGIEGLANLLRTAYDHGINFWDAADEYGSHPHVRRALQGLPRGQVVVVTKTMARKPLDVTRDVERFLRELGTDYIDILLLHCITNKDWISKNSAAMEVLDRAKDQGKVRAVGASIHSFGALEAVAGSSWPDVVMVRINPAGRNMDASPQKVMPVIERLFHAGKAVYGMKIFGAGPLAKDARQMIEYVLRSGMIHAFTIGMTNRQQIHQNVDLVNQLAPQHPLKSPVLF